jgi:hypothetical protein
MNVDYQVIGETLAHAFPDDVGEFVLMFRTGGDGRVHCLSSAGGPAATQQLLTEMLQLLRFGRHSPISQHSTSEPS